MLNVYREGHDPEKLGCVCYPCHHHLGSFDAQIYHGFLYELMS